MSGPLGIEVASAGEGSCAGGNNPETQGKDDGETS